MNKYLVKLTLIKNVREEVPAPMTSVRKCIAGFCGRVPAELPRTTVMIVEKKMKVDRTVETSNQTFALMAVLNEFPSSRVLRVDVEMVDCDAG